ncbi:hypothetical protein DPEC_G00107670 [Dallia pectoralis]|uniref:Uncharacterized protein n=1 Tax=Dallia pectoralis TaxID=75939 RepID=A0ACC2GRV8_DALPE|nr:hypothetical protein DPEC_G00107670 [Dallia pectoralis]
MDYQKPELWKDIVLKEKMLRLNWFRNNWNKTKQVNQVREKPGVKLPQIKQQKPAVKLPQIKQQQPEVKPTRTVVRKGLRINETPPVDVMRPVSRETRDVLYDGFTKEEGGRHKYLHLRKQMSPEDKYTYPITSNSQYGWGQGVMKQAYVPEHAVTGIIRHSFYRKSGIFPRCNATDIPG